MRLEKVEPDRETGRVLGGLEVLVQPTESINMLLGFCEAMELRLDENRLTSFWVHETGSIIRSGWPPEAIEGGRDLTKAMRNE